MLSCHGAHDGCLYLTSQFPDALQAVSQEVKELELAIETSTVTIAEHLEDPALVMAAVSETPVDVELTAREEEPNEVEMLLTAAIVDTPKVVPHPPAELPVVEAKTVTPVVRELTQREKELKEVELLLTTALKDMPTAVPKPPAVEVPVETLLKAAASENIAMEAVAMEGDVTVEFSAKTEPEVKVVSKKVISKPKPKANLPAASPLARLLAEELGLQLTNIGKGSGKNGKILIDDVRTFQARLEGAKKALNQRGAYFATATA